MGNGRASNKKGKARPRELIPAVVSDHQSYLYTCVSQHPSNSVEILRASKFRRLGILAQTLTLLAEALARIVILPSAHKDDPKRKIDWRKQANGVVAHLVPSLDAAH